MIRLLVRILRNLGLGEPDLDHPGYDLPLALSLRRYVDRVEQRGTAEHVALEQTLREREGLPSYIGRLDGVGFNAYAEWTR